MFYDTPIPEGKIKGKKKRKKNREKEKKNAVKTLQSNKNDPTLTQKPLFSSTS